MTINNKILTNHHEISQPRLSTEVESPLDVLNQFLFFKSEGDVDLLDPDKLLRVLL